MTEQTIQPNPQLVSKSLFSETTFILAVITAAGYLIGYMYFRSYYGTLGISLNVIIIPTLELGFMALISASLMAMLLLPLGIKLFEKPKTFFDALLGNSHLLILLVIGVLTAR
jgi:hypothetical protein